LPAAFVIEDLPHEAHDIPVDMLIDERGIVSALRRLP
jgi:5-formyltetrahydrofolate cyclo-ligase